MPAAPNSTQAQASLIVVDGRTLTGPFSFPQQRAGRTYLPVVTIARALGDQIQVNTQGRSVEVTRRTGILADFKADLSQVRENGALVLALSGTADIIFPPNPDELMLPVEIVSALLGASVHLDAETRAVQVTRDRLQAQTVRQGEKRAPFEIYQADYDYTLNSYPSAMMQSFGLRVTGRIGDGRFDLLTNSYQGSGGTRFGLLRNISFTYERPNGQRFIGGDYSTGTDLLFLSSAARGLWAQLPIGGARLTAFAGRSYSAPTATGEPSPLFQDSNLVQPLLAEPSSVAFRRDTSVFGAYLSFGPSAHNPYSSRQLLFSAGALRFKGPARSGEMIAGAIRYSSMRVSLQADAAVGKFKRMLDGVGLSGTGLAIDLSGSLNLTDNLTFQGSYAHASRNFTGTGSGSFVPVNRLAGGVTWRASQWLTATLVASTSSQAETPELKSRFIAATLSITPRRARLPAIFFSHTETSTPQIKGGAFTLLTASKSFSRLNLFLTATRSKTVGPAFLNAQASASLRLGESSLLQLAQAVGSRGSLTGSVDWQTPPLFNRRLNLSAGLGYARSEASSIQTIQRLSATVRLPRANSLQFSYLNSSTGPQFTFSLSGTIFKGSRRVDALSGAPVAEVNSYGAFYGRVYQDLNLNGRYDAGLDRTQSNAQVRLDGSRFVTTDENGLFRIGDVHTGDHAVSLDLMSVRADLTMLDGPQQTVTLLPGRDSIVDFRLVRTGRISGQVWSDENENGVMDEGEQPLADVRVVVGSGRDTLTDENGVFHLGDLPPGEHVVLIDEKTLPEKRRSATGPLTVKVLAGSETRDLRFPIVSLPAEIKRFPAVSHNFRQMPARSLLSHLSFWRESCSIS